LLEVNSANERFIEVVPFRKQEIAAAVGDSDAIEKLAKRLRFTPAPDGLVPATLSQTEAAPIV